jgi:hypothetical protein
MVAEEISAQPHYLAHETNLAGTPRSLLISARWKIMQLLPGSSGR